MNENKFNVWYQLVLLVIFFATNVGAMWYFNGPGWAMLFAAFMSGVLLFMKAISLYDGDTK